MLGAIVGDVVGSPYEVINVYRRTDVHPFKNRMPELGKCRFTDDTVLTIAVAKALEEYEDLKKEELELKIAQSLKEYVERYPLKRKKIPGLKQTSLYGRGFEEWAYEEEIQKRDVFMDCDGKEVSTNGAAMRVAAVGWRCSSVDEVMEIAKITAVYTHGSDASVRASQAIALSIFLARKTKDKDALKRGLIEILNFPIDTSLERVQQIRNVNKKYREKNFVSGKFINCDAETTTEYAIYAFLISNSFSDCIKTAIALGGDSDTIACMAGAIAEAYYGIPTWWQEETFKILEKEGLWAEDIDFIREFREKYCFEKEIHEKSTVVFSNILDLKNETKKVHLSVELLKPEYKDIESIIMGNIQINDLNKVFLNLLGYIYNNVKLIPLMFRMNKDTICDSVNTELRKYTSLQISQITIEEYKERISKDKILQISLDINGWSYSELRTILDKVIESNNNDILEKIGFPVFDVLYETLLSNSLEEVVIERIIEECSPAISEIIRRLMKKKFNVDISMKNLKCKFDKL